MKDDLDEGKQPANAQSVAHQREDQRRRAGQETAHQKFWLERFDGCGREFAGQTPNLHGCSGRHENSTDNDRRESETTSWTALKFLVQQI